MSETPPERPPCFPRRLWPEWLKHAKASRHDPNNYCHDCLPAYQMEMLRAGNCAKPEVEFVIAGDGEDRGICGIVSK